MRSVIVIDECPCKNCLLIPICRYKEYTYLTMDCTKIREHLYKDPNDHHLLRSNRQPAFHGKLTNLDKLFKSNHYSNVVNRSRRYNEPEDTM